MSTEPVSLAGLPAAVYCRISDDREGRELGVQRQEGFVRDLADRLGCRVVRVYTDNDISASTLSKKPRPEYDAMIEAVRAGEVRVVLAYSNSRLTRRPRELEDWITLHETTGVQIDTVVSGKDDLSTADGRMTARIKAGVDAAEAERTGERVKAQKEQRLASGKPPGSRWRTFGYSRDWKTIPDEAQVVREVFERLASGESLNAVTNDLRRRGVQRVSGQPWTYQATLRLVGSDIYCGFVSYKGHRAHRAIGVEPLVSEEVFAAANARRERRPGRVRSRRHLLSGIAVCGRCHAPMSVSGRAKGRSGAYVCNRMAGGCGNVTVQREALDRLVTDAIKTGLFVQSVSQPNGSHADEVRAEQERLGEQLAALDERIEQTQAALSDGSLDFADGVAVLAQLRKNRKRIEQTRTEITESVPEALGLKPLADFESADLGRQVAEVRRNLAGLVVNPVKVRGSNRFDPSRIEAVLPDGTRINGAVLAENSMTFRDLGAA